MTRPGVVIPAGSVAKPLRGFTVANSTKSATPRLRAESTAKPRTCRLIAKAGTLGTPDALVRIEANGKVGTYDVRPIVLPAVEGRVFSIRETTSTTAYTCHVGIARPTCTCPAGTHRRASCKHRDAIAALIAAKKL